MLTAVTIMCSKWPLEHTESMNESLVLSHACTKGLMFTLTLRRPSLSAPLWNVYVLTFNTHSLQQEAFVLFTTGDQHYMYFTLLNYCMSYTVQSRFFVFAAMS